MIRREIACTPLGNMEYARSGEGPAVLLLHGAMGGWDQGLRLGTLAVGSPGFELIAVSRPGYLGTPLAAGREPSRQADLCGAVLDALEVREAAVIAVSGGGQCALQFALRHPQRCRALVMISACSAPIKVSPPLRFQLMVLMARIPPLVSRMRRKLMEDPDRAASRSIPDATLRAQVLNDPVVGPLFRENQLSVLERMADRLAGTSNDIAQARVLFDWPLERIDTPAIVIHGTHDEAVPFAQAESLAARLPHGELLSIAGGRHVSLFTHRSVIQQRVRTFLEAQFASARGPADSE